MLNWINSVFNKQPNRSEWMEGLLSAEDDVQSCGYEHCKWSIRDAQRTGICSYFSSWTKGYGDYLEYYKAKLENNLN